MGGNLSVKQLAVSEATHMREVRIGLLDSLLYM
jgi:hypothetical protein